jgi:multidrug efflux pump
MNFTEVFIRRPVLSIVISLLILVLGLRAYLALPMREFPEILNAVVTVSTTYYGADPDVIAGFVTAPLENAIAQADGIDYLTSTSRSGSSSITANLRINYDPNKALSEINTKVNSVLNQLPPAAQQPVLRVQLGALFSPLYFGFWSDTMPINKMTDYVVRVVQPKVQAVPGVQNASMAGQKQLALRAWLDPNKLAAYGLTATEVNQALAGNNFLSGLGSTKGQMVQMSLNASTDLRSRDEFADLVVKQVNGAVVRLKDVAEVDLGAEDYESNLVIDGKFGLWIAVDPVPSANMLEVVEAVKKIQPEIRAQLPPGLEMELIYDAGDFVNASIEQVVTTLLEAMLIVTLVVFVFLGSTRSVIIPVVAIPLSLVGTFGMMLLFGFTINLLTLLAFVLAIGLVVDDAIIVVENVNRHLEEGVPPLDASIMAARELGGPIIAMAAVLIAVYVPIGFQSGLTGALFTEFAFTLVGAVVISSVVALTLSPMMSSRMLIPHADMKGWEGKVIHFVDRQVARMTAFYRRLLHDSLNYVAVTITFALIVLGSIYYLYGTARSELAPLEDKGLVNAQLTLAPSATHQQRILYGQQLYDRIKDYPGIWHMFQNLGPSMNVTALALQHWDDREVTANEIARMLQKDLSAIAGARGAAFQQPALPGAGGFGAPVQFIIGSTESFERMSEVVDNFVQQARDSGMFNFVDFDLKIDLPRATLEIDRDKAAQLGLRMSDVGSALSAMLGGGYVNYFALEGRSYKVIPQVGQQHRLNADQLLDYHIRTPDGASVPLSTIAKISTKAVPQSFNRFQQMNSVTVSAILGNGVLLGDALTYMQGLAARTLPTGYTTDYAGQSRQFMQESSGFITTFIFALVIIFLVLAALFESFRDPLIILVSVPMSVAGALVFINLGVGGATLNIYTQVGLVTLMGLISKHGILIVRFANQLQEDGLTKRDAVETAAEIRLRPILMTTAAMVLGVVPLLLASGAGAASRFNMGLVIATGISIGTLFTLFVVPGVYLLLAQDHSKDRAKNQVSTAAGAAGPAGAPAE